MLEQILNHIHNWFVVDRGIHAGAYEIKEGKLELPFLAFGQHFRIVGSVFNDGVYCYPTDFLRDETFDGAVWALAIPRQVLSLSEDITAWQEKYGETGPYASESFGGYSYTKATDSKGRAMTWKDAFRTQLNQWRKL